MPKGKILLADDEADLLDAMGARIKNWGYELITASSGQEAVRAVKDDRPDVVILDYKMPEMDGIATLEEIRKINGDIPVIMFTAFPDKRVIEGTRKLKVSAFIPKLSAYSDTQAALKAVVEMAAKKKTG